MVAQDQPQFNVQPQIEVAQTPDLYDAYNSLSNTLKSAGQFASNVVTPVLTYRATQKGKEEGAQPDYSPKGTPLTPIAIAEREAAIQSHTALINNEIRNKVQSLEYKWSTPQSEINPNGGMTENSLKNFQSEMSGWAQGYFEEMPKVFQPDAKLAFSQYATTAQGNVLKRVSTLIQNNQKANLTVAINSNQQDALNKAYGGDENGATALYNVMNQHMTLLKNSGAISQAFYDQTMIPYAQKLNKYIWLGRGHLAIANGKLEAFKQQVENSNLQPLLKRDILNGVNTDVKSFVTESSAKDAELDDQLSQNLSQQLNGGNYNPALATQLAKTDPKQSIAYQDASELVQSTSDLRKNLKYTNFGAAQQMLNQTKLDTKDPNLFWKQSQLQSLKNYVTNNQKQFLNDPAAYVANSPMVQEAAQGATLTPGFNSKTQAEKNLIIKQAKVTASIAQQRALGATPKETSVLTKEDQDLISGAFYSADAQGKQEVVNNLMATYGPYSNIVGRDLVKIGIPQSTLNLANLDKIKDSRASLPLIYEAMESQDLWNSIRNSTAYKQSDFETAARSALSDILPTIGDTGQNGIDYRDNMVKLVAIAAAANTLKTGDSDTASAKKMAKVIYHNRYSQYGDKFRVPAAISPSVSAQAMNAMQHDIDNNKFVPLTRAPGGPELSPQLIKEQDMGTIRNGQWVSYGDDSGVYWVDSNGIPVKILGTNKLYGFNWKDLEMPGSQVNKLMQQYSPKIALSNRIQKGIIAGKSLSELRK